MQTSGANDYEMIRRTLRQRSTATAVFKVPAANPRVGDRLAAVNAALCNAGGAVRIYVDPRCRALIEDLEKCQLVNGELDKRDPKRTHISDALGYLVHRDSLTA